MIAFYYENYTEQIYKNSIRTSQETYYISMTTTNWLMLFSETIAINFENHKKHTNTLCW
jgi:hypothetical protein